MDKKTYNDYAQKITDLLGSEEFYNSYKSNVESGKSTVKLQRKKLVQDISLDWIDFIDDCLPSLDNIVRNPRKFIVQEEDIVDISLARSITTESVKHLAQHTNLISKVSKDGMVTPNKILNVSKEESYEIYENRFIWTLLNKVNTFITMRFDKIKEVCSMQNVLQLDVESRFKIAQKKMSYRMECIAQMPMDELMTMDNDDSTKIERIAKMDRIVKGFLGSNFAKQMKSSAPVRPPITRTNVILKNPNFKKALSLWQFVETYEAKAGYAVSDESETIEVEDEYTKQLRNMVALSTLIFESMYEHDDDALSEDNFEHMDFGQSATPADEDDEGMPVDAVDAELEGEVPDEEAEEELIPEEVPNPEEVSEQEQEDKVEEDSTPEDDVEKADEDEKTDEEEGVGEEGGDVGDLEQPEEVVGEEEEEIEQEKSDEELEKEVEQEEIENQDDTEETDGGDEEDEDEEEEEEEEFDRDLYDIRKLYRRPEDDKLRQEEIAKIRDAIDRCLTVYKNEKKREKIRVQRAERERKRLEDIKRKGEEREEQKRIEASRLGANSYFGVLGTSYSLDGSASKPLDFSTTPVDPDKKPPKPRKKKVKPVESVPETPVVVDPPKRPRGRPKSQPAVAKDPSERRLDLNPTREKEKRKVSGFGLGVDLHDALGSVRFDVVDTKKDDDNNE